MGSSLDEAITYCLGKLHEAKDGAEAALWAQAVASLTGAKNAG